MDCHRPGGIRIAIVMAVLLTPMTGRISPAASSQEIDKAIEKGIAFLYSKQNKDGTWEKSVRPQLNQGKNPQLNLKERQWGGLTAAVSYALLAAGENPQDEKLKGAIEFLERANLQSTYGLGLGSQVWLLMPPSSETRQVVAHSAKVLSLGMIKAGPGAGFFTYWIGTKNGTEESTWPAGTVGFAPQNGESMPYDLSNSQYGVLGMWALSECGAEVPADFWAKAQDAWEKAQQPDGGWRYDAKPDRAVTASMTAAGIATLYITQDYTLSDHWSLCTGGAPNPYIDNGLAWMDRQIGKVVRTPGYYTLYGIERIGVASGRKYFGTTDWYEKGADFIVKHQKPDGSWLGTGELHSHEPIADTCFALLFLARGRAPVMMNKLEYETSKAAAGVIHPWNERPRDLANLARWAGRQMERDLNWQVVNLEVPPEDLHDAPILFLSGSQPLDFNSQEIEKLRTFVEEGGMILANADCAREPFARSFEELGRKLFPGYRLRQLPQNHPIFTREQYMGSRWRTRPIVKGLSNGVRELMLLLPDADPSRAWQTRADRTHENLFELGADIFLYAADKKHLQNKGETYIVETDPNIKAARRIKVARLLVGDNPDPEPGAWKRLAAIMHNQDQVDLTTFDAKPGQGLLVAARIAHMTGTTSFALSDAARLEIKTFVQNGGTLIIDAAGGSSDFAVSAESELHTIFGPDAAQLDSPLPTSSPVYHVSSMKLGPIAYRTFAREVLLRSAKQPRLRGITFANHIRVFYSREDLTAGLVGEPVDGVFGYEPQSAVDLMTAMLLYASSK